MFVMLQIENYWTSGVIIITFVEDFQLIELMDDHVRVNGTVVKPVRIEQRDWVVGPQHSNGIMHGHDDTSAIMALSVFIRFGRRRSEEHTSELKSLMRISYAVFALK